MTLLRQLVITSSALVCVLVFVDSEAKAANPRQAPIETSQSRDLAQGIERILAQIHQEQGLVGLQASVWLKGNMVFSKGLGLANVEHQVPVDPDTRFAIASVNKAFTAALLLRLVSEGKMLLDEDITTYVPEFPPKESGPITVRNLVQQTSGIRHYRREGYPSFYTTHYESAGDSLGIFMDDPLVATPGTRLTYSSFSYNLLAAAMERATETTYAELMSRYILDPLHLENTRYDDATAPVARRADRYSRYTYSFPFTPIPDLMRVPTFDYSFNQGGGNLLSTTEDLVRFGRAVVLGDVLTDEQKGWLATPHTLPDDKVLTWNFGWFLRTSPGDRTKFEINGSNPGVWAFLLVYPDDELVIAAITNTWGRTSWDVFGLRPALQEIEQLCLGRTLAQEIIHRVVTEGVEAGWEAYRSAHATEDDSALPRESVVNTVAYRHLGNREFDVAIRLLRFNTLAHPDSYNAWDSLGEAYMIAGENDKAIECYRKSIELNPDNVGGVKMLEKLGATP